MSEDDHVLYVLAALANHNDVLPYPLSIFSFLCLEPSQLLYSILGVWCNQLSVFCQGITGVCFLHTLEIMLAPNTSHTDTWHFWKTGAKFCFLCQGQSPCYCTSSSGLCYVLEVALTQEQVVPKPFRLPSGYPCDEQIELCGWDADRKYPVQLHLCHIECYSL